MDSISSVKWIVCRICLKHPAEQMLKIFSTEATLENLAGKIHECGGISLDECDELPESICSKCLLLLRVAHKFRTLCQKSQQQLERILELHSDTQDKATETTNELDVASQIENEEVDSLFVKNEVESTPDESNDEMRYIMEIDDTIEQSEPHENVEDVVIDEDAQFVEQDSNQSDEVEYLQEEELATEENYTVPDEAQVFKHDENTTQSTEETLVFEESDDIVNENDENNSKVRLDNIRNRKDDADADSDFKIVQNFTYNEEKPRRKRKLKTETTPVEPVVTAGDDATSQFICFHCGNIYPERAKLTLHLKIHSQEKPHECEICHKRFAQTPQLSRHMNSHTGSRPFKCKFCSSSFADPSTCIKHERIHTNERPYVCDICGKAFSYSNVLKVHMMTHTGEKPYSCDHCGKKFAQLHHKKSHERTHSTQMVLKQEDEEEIES